MRSACTAPIHKTNVCVETIQWDKLWHNFPVVTRSHSAENELLHISPSFRTRRHFGGIVVT